ncbi:MAG: hypothetical protein A3B73_03605 [Omnitrophica WOR_2 bacterium RIFCSPHIGHO2_02_FULL_63_39]|nr:MAG: hypothetical protein A2Z92_02500 [Omnitrophica WOR_2 bacterium GWA2_63_20]OGX18971.1 MAG: hypothetical protein A2105_00935 [Omnitrophica WOR_2 bacterium GWF2_63_9]OGX36875.1 MAG: hypothetical protein A3B73_03605 [Omnitrophica WOR_2 bacterium RIFCSPHIGHO2_02_FULL_63_39]OGX50114.1 MAG: hypothetical protein A3G88_02450 [Omnitrophica WOR_2 bacterium RIFCSPLOWO2_12_FULL_63_16]HBQ37981.1 hypothetical protein [Candidatus Omnitrophota bacterium]
MKWKTTLLLLLLTVGVGAYVSLYELKQPDPEERSRRAHQVLNLHPDDATGLIVASPHGNVTLERTANVWQLISPPNLRADASLISRVLNQLNPLEAEQVLRPTAQRPLAPADYGLQSPGATLTILTANGMTKLLFGDPTAVGATRYLSVEGDPAIFVIGEALFELLDQPLEAFRSHDLVEATAAEVRRITVASPASSYTLERISEPSSPSQADRWRLTQPVEDLADSAEASTIFSALRGLRAERFLAEEFTEGDRARFGLEAPYATITMAVKEGSPPLELAIGQVTEDNDQQRAAMRLDEPTVLAVASSKVEELLRDPQALRSRACFEFFASQVQTLHLTWEGTSWSVERQDDQWKTSTGEALDGAAVEEFLWKVRDLKLTRFVDEQVGSPSAADTPSAAPPMAGPRSLQDLARYGLEPAKGTIQVWLAGDSNPQRLSVGDTIEAGTTRYGLMTGRRAVVELPEPINEILATTPDAFLPKPEPAAESAGPAASPATP